MSARATSAVWSLAPVGASGLVVLLAIADEARDDGQARVDLATIVYKSRLSRSRVIAVIADLERQGLLEVDRGGGRGIKNTYRLVNLGLEKGSSDRTLSPRVNGRAPRTLSAPETVQQTVQQTVPSQDPLRADTVSRDLEPKNLPPNPPTEREDAGVVVAAFIDAHREAFAATPNDREVGRLARTIALVLAPNAGWTFPDVLEAAKRAGRDPYGASALEKHLRLLRGATSGADAAAEADRAARARRGAANFGRTRAPIHETEADLLDELRTAYRERPELISVAVEAWRVTRSAIAEVAS